MHSILFSLIVLPLATFAWLPGDHKPIVSQSGADLFNRSSLRKHGLNPSTKSLPTIGDTVKVRGVNLGAYFIVENWMASTIFASFDCSTKSEFDCVSSLDDQTKADSDFQSHWRSWISANDFKKMVSYGLNTVRIPVGYCLLSLNVTILIELTLCRVSRKSR